MLCKAIVHTLVIRQDLFATPRTESIAYARNAWPEDWIPIPRLTRPVLTATVLLRVAHIFVMEWAMSPKIQFGRHVQWCCANPRQPVWIDTTLRIFARVSIRIQPSLEPNWIALFIASNGGVVVAIVVVVGLRLGIVILAGQYSNRPLPYRVGVRLT